MIRLGDSPRHSPSSLTSDFRILDASRYICGQVQSTRSFGGVDGRQLVEYAAVVELGSVSDDSKLIDLTATWDGKRRAAGGGICKNASMRFGLMDEELPAGPVRPWSASSRHMTDLFHTISDLAHLTVGPAGEI